MSKISVDSFLATVRKSELVESAKLKTCLDAMRENGVDFGSSATLASGLVERGVLTEWQVQNLLKGKHRGYALGKYRLLSLLGRGGMSAVYLAEHTLMRRRCAIKVLPTKRVGESSYLGRFHREAQAVASLDHPNIVRAYDVDHAVEKGKEIHFLVMEYVEGRDLQQIVDQDGPLDFQATVEYCRQSADGFHHAHQSGLVHRDVKPANLLVDQNGVVKILDLGLARFFDDQDEKSLTVANDEKVLGTADYLAPEQAMDSHTADHRADVYGLGCSMYFTLCGHPPFNEGTLTQRLMAHQTKEPTPIEEEREGVPESLVLVLRKMMAKKPEDRYQTMEEVSHALRDWLLAHADEDWLAANSKIVVASRDDSNPQSGASGKVALPTTPAPEAAPPAETVESPVVEAPVVEDPVVEAPAVDVPPVEAPAVDVPAAAAPATAEQAAPAPVVEPTFAPQPAAEDELSSFLTNLGGSPAEEPAPFVTESKTETVTEAPTISIDTGPKPSDSTPTPDTAAPPPAEPVAQPVEDEGLGIGDEPEGDTGGAVVFPVAEPEAVAAAPAEVVAEADVAEAEVEEAGEFAPVEAEPTPTGHVAPRSSGGGGLLSSQAVQVGIASVGGLLTVLLAVYLFQAFSSGGGGSDDDGNGEVLQLDSREIVVGPDGQFPTLFEAVEHLSRLPRSNQAEPWTIEVAGGTMQTDPVFVDGGAFPANVTIKSSGDEPAVLVAAEGVPALQIIGADHLVLDGLVFDADGNDVAVQVEDQVGGVEFRNSTFRNYKTGGLVGAGCYVLSGDPLLVSGCEFAGDKPTAAGVRLQKSFSTPSNLVFRGNRFTGKQRVGFALDGESQSVVLAENVFDGPSVGVEVTDKGLAFDGLTIVNNTFHGTKNGVLFRKMPTGKGGLLARNLFVSKEGVEVGVSAGNNDGQFKQKVKVRENWSLRAKPDKPPKAFVSAIASWGEPGKVLQSAKAGDKGFLKPKADGPLAKVGKAGEHEKAHVGALAP